MLVDTSTKSIVKSKYNRIVSAIQPVASQGHVFVDKAQTDFIDQFVNFKLGIDHDDILDASANALLELINPHLELGEDEYAETWGDDDVPKLGMARGCP
jgi:phage terminase large subunit-like protein